MCSFSHHGKTLYFLTLFLFCNNSLFYCLFNSKINYASKENMSRERIQNKNIMYMYVMNLHFFTHQIDYININQPHVDSHLIPFTLVLYANILKNPLSLGGGGVQHLRNLRTFQTHIYLALYLLTLHTRENYDTSHTERSSESSAMYLIHLLFYLHVILLKQLPSFNSLS